MTKARSPNKFHSSFGIRASFVIRPSSLVIALNHFAQRLATGIDQMLWAASQVGHGHLVDVDAEVVIERGEHGPKLHWPFSRFAAKAISRADDLAGLHASGSQQSAGNARPMITAGVFVNRRGPSKFAPDHDRNILIEAALMNVFDQCA